MHADYSDLLKSALSMENDRVPPLVSSAGYAVATMLVVVPLLNLISDWPPRLDAAAWRFEQFRLLANALPPATLGLALALYVSRTLGHRRRLAGLAGATLIGAIMLLLLLANFGLDSAELASQVPAGETGRFRLTVLRVALQAVVVVVTLFTVGAAAWWSYRRNWRRQREAVRGSSTTGPLVRQPKQIAVE